MWGEEGTGGAPGGDQGPADSAPIPWAPEMQGRPPPWWSSLKELISCFHPVGVLWVPTSAGALQGGDPGSPPSWGKESYGEKAQRGSPRAGSWGRAAATWSRAGFQWVRTGCMSRAREPGRAGRTQTDPGARDAMGLPGRCSRRDSAGEELPEPAGARAEAGGGEPGEVPGPRLGVPALRPEAGLGMRSGFKLGGGCQVV